MFGVFLVVAALQGPWSATSPRTDHPAAPIPVRTNAGAPPRQRLDIDLSGLSDDDAVAVPGFSPASTRGSTPSAPSRSLVWSPRQGSVTNQSAPPAQRPVATLALARDFGDDPPSDRIDPAIADLIGSVQLPMVSNANAQRPRTAAPVAARTLARALAPRRYEPGRW